MHTCPSCATVVIGAPTTCPHCGAVRTTTRAQTRGAVALALVALLGCNDGNDPVALYGVPVNDADGDGFFEGEDCDDSDPAVNPDATEVPGNGVDDDCDGTIDESEEG